MPEHEYIGDQTELYLDLLYVPHFFPTSLVDSSTFLFAEAIDLPREGTESDRDLLGSWCPSASRLDESQKDREHSTGEFSIWTFAGTIR